MALAVPSVLAQAPNTVPQQAAQNPVTITEVPTAKDLAFLIGKWDTTIVIPKNELMPQGTTGHGIAEFHLFGQVVEGTRTSETSSGRHEQRELIVYQPATATYQDLIISGSGTMTERTMTRYVDYWVVEYQGQRNDKDFTVRGRYKIVSDNEIQFSSEVNFDNSGYKPYSVLTFTRIGAK
jgi:hypothetical protein